jgi:RND superfamily putative drug exporter
MESKPALERIGRAANRYRWLVVATWLLVAAGFGVFAPSLDHALSGAGWQVTGSDSLAARDQIDARFGGMSSQSAVVVVRSDTVSTSDPAFRAVINNAQAILATSTAFHTPAVEQVSPDGHTVMLQSGAATNPDGVTRAAEDLSPRLAKLSGPAITVSMTGSPAFWGDFNNVTRSGMVRAETLSWPLTAIVLVIAFGSLAAAGLPLLLTLAGLLTTMGILYTITRFTDLSIWSLNFAMMFALALGIDYALFIVTRYRAALHAHPDDSRTAVGIAMNTAGKAVLFSGLTVLVSLSAVLIVPIPAFRTIAIGMILAVTLVLLLIILGAASVPLLGVKTGMPSIKVLPETAAARQGYDAIASAFGTGAPGPIQIVVPPSADAAAMASHIRQVKGVAAVFPPQSGADGYTLLTAIATTDPSSSASRDVVDAIRAASPAGVLVGGPVAENHDLANSLAHNTPIVIGTVMVLGFLLLLIALRGLVIAAAGVLLNLLSVAAAFGVGVLAFQHGWLAGPLGFESQGYLTAWAPLFFFALVFALSMDYTVFLLASAREHFEISGNPDEAVRGAIAHSAQPIVAAAAVMVVVFFTFAIAGPLPVKEMGIILGVAVFLDALLVRLIVVPALLRLLGHAAWWTPRWVDRVLPEVRFAH